MNERPKMRLTLTFALLAATASEAACQTAAVNPPATPAISASVLGGYDASIVFRLASKSVAVVYTDARRQGSAVAFVSVANDGTLFATNCHVLEDATRAQVAISGGTHDASFIGGSPDTDACLLFVSGINVEVPEMLNPHSVIIGEKVFAIGTPRGLTLSISEGIVSGKRGSWLSPPQLLQTTAPISPGSSGGGLFDARARLLGITTFYLVDGQNLNFAVSVNDINAAIQGLQNSKIRTLADLTEILKRKKQAKKREGQ
jgi:serine protease Do